MGFGMDDEVVGYEGSRLGPGPHRKLMGDVWLVTAGRLLSNLGDEKSDNFHPLFLVYRNISTHLFLPILGQLASHLQSRRTPSCSAPWPNTPIGTNPTMAMRT